MSKMSKIDQIHLRAVMLCMSKMSKIDQIHLRAVMLCMSKMSKIDQIHLRAVMLCLSKMSKIDKVHIRGAVADPGGAEGAMAPPRPVKIGHKKDGRRRWPHRFHVSRPPPYPAAGSATGV